MGHELLKSPFGSLMEVGLSQGKGADGREKRHNLRGSEADVQVQR